MAIRLHIRNPAEWAVDQVVHTGAAARSVVQSVIGTDQSAAPPVVRRITVGDLKDVLIKGLEDTGAYRTDVFFLCLFYPVIGLILIALTFHQELLPLAFPLAAGFARYGTAPTLARKAYDAFRVPTPSEGTNLNERLFDLSGNGRDLEWRVAWEVARDHPVLRSGAGTCRRR